jgi:hypothetical protein
MASLSSSVAGHGWQWRKPRRARTLWGQRKGPDEEWLKLYAFQEQYRKEHNVTASHILKEIGLFVCIPQWNLESLSLTTPGLSLTVDIFLNH